MRVLWRLISIILSHVWKGLNFIRILFFNLFILLIAVLCIGVIWSQYKSTASDQSILTKPKILKLDLKGVLVDKPANEINVIAELGKRILKTRDTASAEISTFELVEILKKATNDKNIDSIVLDLKQFVGADPATLSYIGKYLSAFKQQGKMIYAFSEDYSQSQYYLASFANKIYLGHQGSVDLHGFATHHLYFKNLLDKAGVTAHIFRVGTYKSAVEPYLRNEMSPEARQADGRWISQLWDNYLQTVANNRNLTPEQVFPATDTLVNIMTALNGDSAAYAVNYKLVDGVMSRTQFEKQMSDKVGVDPLTHQYRAISADEYWVTRSSEQGNIAVIIANGAIVDGQGRDGETGSDVLTDQIQHAIYDNKIKGIILRINSPGGSVSASEQIRESLQTARDAGKSIVVSMGGMAASGGYWIASPANWIVASPSTLTGSIGIFGIINTVENLLAKVGVNTDGVSTSPLADISMTKALPESTTQLIQLNVENGYRRFISLVATSRHKTEQQIDKIAQGHVWTGSDAKHLGLVDQLGDFDDAVNKMQVLTHVQKAELVFYTQPQTFFATVIGQLTHASMAHMQSIVPATMITALQGLQLPPTLTGSRPAAQNIYAICQDCSIK